MDLLRQKLTGLINITKRKRPYRCEVEYVESTQQNSFFPLFPTDNIVDSTTTWEVRLAFNDVSFTGQLMGFGYSGNNRYNLGIESNKFRFAYSTSWFDAGISTPDTNPHTWKLNPTGLKTADAYLDGQKTSVTASSDFGAHDWFIGVGGRSTSNNQIQSGSQIGWKLYYSKIWKAGKLVVDVIPVIDWNEKPCLYDKVSGKLIYATILYTPEAGGVEATITSGREIHPVEYIESTGTQYIDTGLKGNLETKIESKVYSAKIDSTSGYCIAGDFTTSSKAITMPFNFTNSGLYSRFGDKAITGGIQQQDGTYTFAVDKVGYYVDGTKIADLNTTTDFTTSGTMMLFGFTGLGRNYLVGKMYYCKIWDNNALVRDYIPAIDETGKGYMFDKVSHTIYDNAGTGIFKYPPVEVEYLQSSGTQYIDTPATFKDTDTVEFKGALLTLTSDKFCMSPTTWNAGNNRFSMLGYYSPSLGVAFGSQGTPSTIFVPNLVDTDVHTVRFEDRKFTMLDTGSVYNPTSAVTFANETDGIKMFYGYNAPTSCKFYYYKHWRDGAMKYNFVAALCNGVAGLYDKVNNIFYPNNGTGDFTYGKIKN